MLWLTVSFMLWKAALMPASDYERIAAENVRRRGEEFDDIGRLISERLYPDRARFLYELLQNAEDALARRHRTAASVRPDVVFHLFEDRLEFRHFGDPFTEADVRAISDVLVGTKGGDPEQVGEFGIGFKSVYAFTASPEIHSGDEHFVIRRFIRPESKTAVPGLAIEPGETVFVFPFDHANLARENAFSLIERKLKVLDTRVLLFLRELQEIKWEVKTTGIRGHYLKEVERDGRCRRVTLVSDALEPEPDWLVFEREAAAGRNATVEVAFQIAAGTDGNRSVKRISVSPLVVYFPTNVETGLGFLIQGPYNTTPARDNILLEDETNNELVATTAHLVAESLFELRDRGLMSVSLLQALPISEGDLKGRGKFKPIFDAVVHALRGGGLLPTMDGGFVAGQNAMMARRPELTSLFSTEQMRRLYGEGAREQWLVPQITVEHDEVRELAHYLRDVVGVEEVRPDGIARRITREYMEAQDDLWVRRLYEYLEGQEALWRPGRFERDSGPLHGKPLLRLPDGRHVSLLDSRGQIGVWLGPAGKGMRTVKAECVSSPKAKAFVEALGVPAVDVVAKRIVPIEERYRRGQSVDERENRAHWSTIEEVWRGLSSERRRELKERLGRVNIVGSVSAATGKWSCRPPGDCYLRTPDLERYFHGNPAAWFTVNGLADEEILREMGVAGSVRVASRESGADGNVRLEKNWGRHSRGLDGFDPNAEVDGIEYAVRRVDEMGAVELSRFIWNELACPNVGRIRGVVERSPRQSFSGSTKETEWSKFGVVLRDSAWLPDGRGSMVRPALVSLRDLPEGFREDHALARALELREPRDERLADELGVAPETLRLARELETLSDSVKAEVQRVIEQNRPRRTPGFPERPVANRDRRARKVREEIREAPQRRYESRERSVRVTRAKPPGKDTVGEYYTMDGRVVCQICREVMPFRRKDGSDYFEGVEALSREEMPKEHPANCLALCPVCAARYVEYVRYDPEAQAKLARSVAEASGLEIEVELDRKEAIRFVEAHLFDLQTTLAEAGRSVEEEGEE